MYSDRSMPKTEMAFPPATFVSEVLGKAAVIPSRIQGSYSGPSFTSRSCGEVSGVLRGVLRVLQRS